MRGSRDDSGFLIVENVIFSWSLTVNGGGIHGGLMSDVCVALLSVCDENVACCSADKVTDKEG